MNTISYCRSQLIPLILLIVTLFGSCKSTNTYSLKKEGSDYILDGCVQKDELLDPKKYSWFYYGYKACRADSAILRQLKPYASGMRVICFAGSWCSDTQRELPRLIWLLDRIGVPENHYQIFMLNRKKQSAYLKPEVWNIEKVPTFIFYKDGKECGRYVEENPSPLEKLMLTWYESAR